MFTHNCMNINEATENHMKAFWQEITCCFYTEANQWQVNIQSAILLTYVVSHQFVELHMEGQDSEISQQS